MQSSDIEIFEAAIKLWMRFVSLFKMVLKLAFAAG